MTDETRNKRRDFITNVLYWGLILAIAAFVLKYFIRFVMPFFIALIIAACARPIARLLSGTTKKALAKPKKSLHKKLAYNVAAIISVILLYLVIAGLLAAVIVPVTSLLTNAAGTLPGLYTDTISPALTEGVSFTRQWMTNMSPEAASIVDSVSSGLLSSLGSAVTSLSAKAVSLASNIVTGLPNLLIQTLICLIASVFIAVDLDRMQLFLKLNLEAKTFRTFEDVKRTLAESVWKYIRSYFLIFLITMAEVTIGSWLIGVKYAGLIGALVAVFDALPIVGSGMILLPWSIITLMSGATGKGIALFVLYLVVVIARQFLEPKIVGKQVGLRPFVTLFLMYVGNKLFGVLGLFGLPIACAILVQLNDAGYPLFKRVEGDTDPGPAETERAAEKPPKKKK